MNTRNIFVLLFLEYQVCLKCIFRIYSIDHPRFYTQPQLYLEILPALLGEAHSKREKQYKLSQCCIKENCWLCQQVFQKNYISRVISEILGLIKEKSFEKWSQFKLNIRTPNIILLKSIILCRFIYFNLSKQTKQEDQIRAYYNLLLLPYESGKFIEPKTVLKWLIALELNEETSMTSTSDENPDNLTISIEQDCEDPQETAIMRQFCSYLGLEKKKEKAKGRKTCLDLGEEKNYSYANQQVYCNANNIKKILTLQQHEFQIIFSKIPNRKSFWNFILGEGTSGHSISRVTHKISLSTRNIYLCGRYIKFSRYLSQTPWMVGGKKLTEGSLQQEIQNKIFTLFYPGRSKQQIETKFHSGGREDIDVRMLQGGRPFVLQFVNPIKPIKALTEEEVIKLIPQAGRQIIHSRYAKYLQQIKEQNDELTHSWRIVKLMQLIINFGNQYVQVLQLQETTESFISVELKAAEMEKVKHYLCVIHSTSPFTNQDKAKLQSFTDLNLEQLTPLRVLHRRTLMTRNKTIHKIKMHLIGQKSAILEVWASAGTYIKQFVHGDLGRTSPNVGQLIGKQVDILQLDVGNLKQGEWKQGDEQLMKIDKFQWMD